MASHVVRGARMTETLRALPEEVPVALVYNGTTQAVMMATPADLEDFGRGFTRTENLGELESIEVVSHDVGYEVRMWLPAEQAEQLADRRRAMAGPVGCGLCGIDSLAEAVRPIPPARAEVCLTSAQVSEAMTRLRDGQALHDKTRAVHGAGFFKPGEGMIAVREDVGRHNALDKLIGAVPDCGQGVLVLTSRISVDMVQKAAFAGAPIILAVSAPTTLAIETADQAGLTLVALVRDETFEIFTHPSRIETKEATDVA